MVAVRYFDLHDGSVFVVLSLKGFPELREEFVVQSEPQVTGMNLGFGLQDPSFRHGRDDREVLPVYQQRPQLFICSVGAGLVEHIQVDETKRKGIDYHGCAGNELTSALVEDRFPHSYVPSIVFPIRPLHPKLSWFQNLVSTELTVQHIFLYSLAIFTLTRG